MAVVPASIGWSDLGSWSALRDHRGGGGAAGHLRGGRLARSSTSAAANVLVHAAGGRTVAMVGLEGVVVVDTPDALLVISADAAQDVKKVVDQLKDEGREDLL